MTVSIVCVHIGQGCGAFKKIFNVAGKSLFTLQMDNITECLKIQIDMHNNILNNNNI